MSSHETRKLSEFDSEQLEINNSRDEKTANTDSNPQAPPQPTNSNPPELDPIYTDTPGTDNNSSDSTAIFNAPPPEYPVEAIHQQESGSIDINLCTATTDTPIQSTMSIIGGEGGFGSRQKVANPDETYEILKQLIGGPAYLGGGGSLTTEPNVKLGLLTSVDTHNDSLKIGFKELYKQSPHHSHLREREIILGSWIIAVPQNITDYKAATIALTDWDNDTIPYLNPRKKQINARAEEAIEIFNSLTPADKITIPVYNSRLEVISEGFETHAISQRGTLSNKRYPVKAITVDNPNGGFYQLGAHIPESAPEEIPTCYISRSQSSPPTPNTAFSVEDSFKLDELDYMEIPNPPNPTCIPPDTDILESPLPEPRLRRSLTDIDHIGEKTQWKLSKACDDRVSPETIAYSVCGEGDVHSKPEQKEILEIINTVPHSETIINQLKDINESLPQN